MGDIAIQFSAACRICNPDEPIYYDDRDERDHEAQEHANKTGHILDVGFCVK
jgi:hypothetical protein